MFEILSQGGRGYIFGKPRTNLMLGYQGLMKEIIVLITQAIRLLLHYGINLTSVTSFERFVAALRIGTDGAGYH
jgi:hypothetical protein